MPAAKTIVIVRPETLARAGRRIAVDKLDRHELSGAVAIWNSLRAGRRFPRREDLTPRAFVKLLGHVALVSVQPNQEDYEFRVVGHQYQLAHGFTLQGKTTADIDRVSPGYGSALKRVFSSVCRKGEPVALRGTLEKDAEDAPLLRHESLYLPFGPNEKTVDHILGISFFAEEDRPKANGLTGNALV